VRHADTVWQQARLVIGIGPKSGDADVIGNGDQAGFRAAA
jgi:hypothetical protein